MAESLDKKFLFKLWDGREVYEVNGNYIRSNDIGEDHIDFCEGGHWLAFKYIPEPEIWVERMLSIVDEMFNALHEIMENTLMVYDIDLKEYLSGHEAVCTVEEGLRGMIVEVLGRRSTEETLALLARK
jgi:hypothetical protein